jgi:uncharacterized membrane protein
MATSQPKIDLPNQPLELILHAGAILLVCISWGLYFQNISALPEQIPIHFNIQGNVDRYGSKSSLMWLAILSTCTVLGLLILSRFPSYINYPIKITAENAPFEYQKGKTVLAVVNALTAALLTYILYRLSQVNTSGVENLGPIFYVLVGTIMVFPIGLILFWNKKKA